MTNCEKCEKKIGMFAYSTSCSDDDCTASIHSECADACENCDYVYCSKHLKAHECSPDSDDDEESEEEEMKEFNITIMTDNADDYTTPSMSKKQAFELSDIIDKQLEDPNTNLIKLFLEIPDEDVQKVVIQKSRFIQYELRIEDY